jgi:hypothetical protein
MNALPRLTWLVVDGLPLWLLERFRAEVARLPTLAWLWREHRIAGLTPVAPNCQTPPSLLSLFSGTSPVEHGLTGFEVPDRDEPLGLRNGFEAYARHIPMVWDRYAAEGQAIRLCQIPYVDRARLGTALRGASYGYKAPIVAQMAIGEPLAGSTHALAGIDATLTVVGARGRGIVVRVEGDTMGRTSPVMVPRDGWTTLALPGGLATLAGLVAVEEKAKLVLLGAWPDDIHGDAARTSPSAPFIAGGLAQLYRRGDFGRIAVDGGSGAAESVLFAAVAALARRFWAEAIDAQARGDCDLIVAYQPAYDLLFHEVLGLIDESLALCDPVVARRVDAMLLKALRDIDAGLAALLAGNGAGQLIVSSDHGMKAVDTVILPNVALRQLGLLATKSDGSIDPQASAAFYHPAETGVVCFAPDRLDARGLCAEGAMDALVVCLGQASGRPCTWFTADIPEVGPRGFVARHYLAPGKGQLAKAKLASRTVERARKSADHATANGDPQLIGVVADLSAIRVPSWPAQVATEQVLPLLLAAA